jgi:hypothetical protein
LEPEVQFVQKGNREVNANGSGQVALRIRLK